MFRRALFFLLTSLILTFQTQAESVQSIDDLRGLVGEVGPVMGSAMACKTIPRSNVDKVINEFWKVLQQSVSQNDRAELSDLFTRSLADGRAAIKSGKTNCEATQQRFTAMEQSISGPERSADPAHPASTVPPAAPAAATAAPAAPTAAPAAPTAAPAAPTAAPAAATAAPAAATAAPAVPTAAPAVPTTAAAVPTAAHAAPSVHGITENEIKFGMVAPFTGMSKDIGRMLEIGITSAFNRANDEGGIHGRKLRLIVADDGYEPTRTVAAVKQLYENKNVFAFIGNYGTPTGAAALPYLIDHRILLFNPFTGAAVFRRIPPDRYVFNFRASYDDEMDAVVRYLLKVRHLQPKQIAVFAQDDSYGDAGYGGVAKAFRALGLSDAAIPRWPYKRNTVDVDQAVNSLKLNRKVTKAVIMVASYRAAAKFIEQTRDLYPGMIYTNTSFTGSNQLSNELMLLGPRFAPGVIVTQVLPNVSGNSTEVLEYKDVLSKYFPNEAAADYVSFEGYIAANILIEALKRVGPQVNTEKLISTLEDMRDIDVGIGTSLNFSRADHQASHNVWGTQIDEKGNYQYLELK